MSVCALTKNGGMSLHDGEHFVEFVDELAVDVDGSLQVGLVVGVAASDGARVALALACHAVSRVYDASCCVVATRRYHLLSAIGVVVVVFIVVVVVNVGAGLGLAHAVEYESLAAGYELRVALLMQTTDAALLRTSLYVVVVVVVVVIVVVVIVAASVSVVAIAADAVRSVAGRVEVVLDALVVVD